MVLSRLLFVILFAIDVVAGNQCFFAFGNKYVQGSLCDNDWYSAVVVQYSPIQDANLDPQTNILNNVKAYVNLTNIANEKFQPDIIVFPEAGLKGYGNKEEYVVVPDPEAQITPCANDHYEAYQPPLVQLSCVARATQTYVVVNLGEKYYDVYRQKTFYYNTDVVFDSKGTIIARYRKINLFLETGKTPSTNRELVYFDTSFGVRFGIFTCFDIIFEDPPVLLANKFNISHFIFPSAWFSQLPFLTAIQEQYYWSFTQDVVLLAAGYNYPPCGSSGSGIYFGRLGPAIYNMTQLTNDTFMLNAQVPKKLYTTGKTLDRYFKDAERIKNLKTDSIIITKDTKVADKSNRVMLNKLTMKQEDFLKMYDTKLIVTPTSSMQGFEGSNFTVPFRVRETICQNSLCCDFTLEMLAIFNKTTEEIKRGDDYTQMFYRLAVFDGIRNYDHIANGGLQTCAVISCVNTDVSSCGLRSDSSSAQPYMIYGFFQTAFTFESITINGNFSNNNSFVGPNVLLTGEGNNFGALLTPDSFTYRESHHVVNGTLARTFQTVKSIPKLVTASIYGRLFSRDDQPPPRPNISSGSGFDVIVVNLIIITVLIFNDRYTIHRL